MELFRVARNAWGQETLIGVSWDLVWVFVIGAAGFIVCHMLYKALFEPRRREDPAPGPDSG